jgi:hypothetical protein
MHDFIQSRDFSEAHAHDPFWEVVCREAFPDFRSMDVFTHDGWHQRAGVDRVVTLNSSRRIEIDDKVRRTNYNDFFLETWSDVERKRPGWILQPLKCDYIGYAFLPSRRCYLLPFNDLRRAWTKHGADWSKRFGTLPVPNRSWKTEGVPVPIDIVLRSIHDGMLIRWPEEKQQSVSDAARRFLPGHSYSNEVDEPW